MIDNILIGWITGLYLLILLKRYVHTAWWLCCVATERSVDDAMGLRIYLQYM